MKNEIRTEIGKLLDMDSSTLTDTEPLISSGLLNSIKVVELASWIESHYQIDFEKNGFNVYDFESIESLIALIESKR